MQHEESLFRDSVTYGCMATCSFSEHNHAIFPSDLMPYRNRLFIGLISAQSVCLCAGLWAHHQFAEAVFDHHRQQVEVERVAQSVSEVGTIAISPSEIEPAASTFSGPSPTDIEVPTSLVWMVNGFSFVWILSLQGITAWLMIGKHRGETEKQQLQAQEEAMLKTKELVRTRDAIVFGLAKLAESRDPETGMHLERIAHYSTRLATALRKHRRYREVVTGTFVNTIGISSALHDIGKVGVEDAVLLKPAKLTREEHYRIQTHPVLGGECIRQIERRLGHSNFLEMAREIALHHHERWDGAGYPDGLMGEKIPLAARIVAIADVYDALSTRRCYKEAFEHDRCVAMIEESAGTQFDPELVEVFSQISLQFKEIADRFRDSSEQSLVESNPFPSFSGKDSQTLPSSGAEPEANGTSTHRFSVYPIESWTA